MKITGISFVPDHDLPKRKCQRTPMSIFWIGNSLEYVVWIYIDTFFEWDQGNLAKNWDQHDVSSGECEQIFFNRPLIIKRDKEHSKNENRYYVLGRTNVNRLLFAVFTVHNDKIRIISARDMADVEIERYLK